TAENPHQQQLDLVWHIRGQHCALAEAQGCDNPLDGPLARMTSCHEMPLKASTNLRYSIDGQTEFNQQLITDSSATLLLGYAPDNPATSDL
ncbi:alginate lyase, partial [Vibrio sp. 10N.222.54.F6]